MTAAAALHELRAILAPKGAWTQGPSKNRAGGHVPPTHPAACCWCLEDAINLLGLDSTTFLAVRAHLRRACGMTPWIWNDTFGRTQAEVLRVIALAEEEARRAALPLSETGS